MPLGKAWTLLSLAIGKYLEILGSLAFTLQQVSKENSLKIDHELHSAHTFYIGLVWSGVAALALYCFSQTKYG